MRATPRTRRGGRCCAGGWCSGRSRRGRAGAADLERCRCCARRRSAPPGDGRGARLPLRAGQERSAGSEASSPKVATWLGDIRRYFPREVVAFMEKDAVERKGLRQLLMEPEVLQSLEKDVGLVATILAFKHLMPEQTRQTARQVVAAIVEDLRQRLENETRQALLGAMRRDRHSPLKVARNLDLRRTVREGLRHYQPELQEGRPGADPLLREPAAVPRVAGDRAGRPERLDGRVGGLRLDHRGGVRVAAGPGHPARLLRHRHRRRQRSAFGPGRDPVRGPAWRRHRHRQGGPLRRLAGRAAGEDAVPADHRPVRGRQLRPTCSSSLAR